MNDLEPESFEAELRQVRPARPSRDFMARLEKAVAPEPQPEVGRAGDRWWNSGGWRLLRWSLAAGSAAILLVLLAHQRTALHPKTMPAIEASTSGSATDSVNIEHQLVADFDTVAQAPGGAPVRFRCREWVDQVVLRDRDRGVVIERRQPRLELIPVSFETY